MILDKPFIFKFLKFATVGTISFVADFGTTYICKEKLKLNKFVANTMGIIVGVIINFTLNRWWTFAGQTHPDVVQQFLKFLMIAGSALLLNNTIIYVFM